MKSIKFCAVLLLVLTAFFSCDKLDELTEVGVTDDFSEIINVDVTISSGGFPIPFSVSKIFSIADNERIRTNFDKIESVKVNSLTYEFTNYGAVTGGIITNASIEVGEDIVIALADINIGEADTANTVFAIDDVQNLIDIATTFKNSEDVKVVFKGVIDETPVKFDFIVNVNVTAVIDVI